MNFKDILVQMDNSPQCAARLDLAIDLAVRHKAQLTGFYAILHTLQSDNVTRRSTEAEELFRQKTAGAGICAEWFPADWGIVPVDMVEMLNYYTHQRDLIIIGQTDKNEKGGDVPVDLPERVIMGAGRPVLVVPYIGTFSTAGKRVIVAWKPGRASARAINDAMPFLLNAEEVHVLSIKTPEDAAGKRPECDICKHLERHGIRVKEQNLVSAEIPVANILMTYAWENGCDLIVMGAFAHMARGTVTVGPVAKQLLESMTLPVLMSD